MPEVIALDGGGYRMFYGSPRNGRSLPPGDIHYAESSDGVTWTVKGTALTGSNDPSAPDWDVAGPSIVRLPDGRWRMYYQAAPTPPTTPKQTPSFSFRSAISSDGVHFTAEGKIFPTRLGGDGSAFMYETSHGRVVQTPGGYVAILGGHMTNNDPRNGGVFVATSDDGLSFTQPVRLLAEFHDPLVIHVGNVYRLYTVNSSPNRVAQFQVTYSSDAVHWPCDLATVSFADRAGTALHSGGTSDQQNGIGDVGGVVMSNGDLRLFTNWRGGIASYTRVSPASLSDHGTCRP